MKKLCCLILAAWMISIILVSCTEQLPVAKVVTISVMGI